MLHKRPHETPLESFERANHEVEEKKTRREALAVTPVESTKDDGNAVPSIDAVSATSSMQDTFEGTRPTQEQEITAKELYRIARYLFDYRMCEIPNIMEPIKELLQLACDREHKAAYLLGQIYEERCNGGSDRDATDNLLRLYELAAKLGNSDAANYLGSIYMSPTKQGISIEKNITKAIEFFKLATSLGHDGAPFNLGMLYEEGEDDLKCNLTEAVKYYEIAAELGSRRGAHRLGMLYESGEKIERNISKAVRYYKRAVELNSEHGDHNNVAELLIRLYEKGADLAENEDNILALRKVALEFKHFIKIPVRVGHYSYPSEGQRFCINPQATSPEKEEEILDVLRFYQLAYEKGNPDAAYQLALHYTHGRGTGQSIERAKEILRKLIVSVGGVLSAPIAYQLLYYMHGLEESVDCMDKALQLILSGNFDSGYIYDHIEAAVALANHYQSLAERTVENKRDEYHLLSIAAFYGHLDSLRQLREFHVLKEGRLVDRRQAKKIEKLLLPYEGDDTPVIPQPEPDLSEPPCPSSTISSKIIGLVDRYMERYRDKSAEVFNCLGLIYTYNTRRYEKSSLLSPAETFKFEGEAVVFYKKAMDLGSVGGMINFEKCLELGAGIEQNVVLAAELSGKIAVYCRNGVNVAENRLMSLVYTLNAACLYKDAAAEMKQHEETQKCCNEREQYRINAIELFQQAISFVDCHEKLTYGEGLSGENTVFGDYGGHMLWRTGGIDFRENMVSSCYLCLAELCRDMAIFYSKFDATKASKFSIDSAEYYYEAIACTKDYTLIDGMSIAKMQLAKYFEFGFFGVEKNLLKAATLYQSVDGSYFKDEGRILKIWQLHQQSSANLPNSETEMHAPGGAAPHASMFKAAPAEKSPQSQNGSTSQELVATMQSSISQQDMDQETALPVELKGLQQ